MSDFLESKTVLSINRSGSTRTSGENSAVELKHTYADCVTERECKSLHIDMYYAGGQFNTGDHSSQTASLLLSVVKE